MKSTLLALELGKVSYSKCLTFADFLVFDIFLIVLDLIKILSILLAQTINFIIFDCNCD